MNNGLHADAMILVRRIFSGDERKLADIEARFLSTRPSSNPVMTLVAVASGQPAPVLVTYFILSNYLYCRQIHQLTMLEAGDRMPQSFSLI